jgi:hypothetical protein
MILATHEVLRMLISSQLRDFSDVSVMQHDLKWSLMEAMK